MLLLFAFFSRTELIGRNILGRDIMNITFTTLLVPNIDDLRLLGSKSTGVLNPLR